MGSPGVCILVSGGLDSAVLIQEGLSRGKTVHPLFVAVGFTWEKAELFYLNRLLEKLRHSELQPLTVLSNPLKDLFPRHWAFTGADVPDAQSLDESVYLPARNLLLLTEAALFAQARNIGEAWLGVLKGNPFPDGREAFFRSFQETCRIGLPRPLKIEAPFQKLSKEEILTRYPDFPYDLTFSCIRPEGTKPCGDCNKCEERRKTFQKLSLPLPKNL